MVTAIRTEALDVRRTALIASLGPEPAPGAAIRELWYVLHGYSMRAVPFLEDFRPVDDGSRLIVAPEALSRYYDGPLTAHKTAPVVASWMTRDEREAEIRDYVAYLDRLHEVMTRRFAGSPPPVTVLGFSQGGATALRWVVRGTVVPARVIVWASSMPPELDYANNERLRAATFTYVSGTADQFITAKVLDQQLGMLHDAKLPCRSLSFDGGHRMDDATLKQIASAS